MQYTRKTARMTRNQTRLMSTIQADVTIPWGSTRPLPDMGARTGHPLPFHYALLNLLHPRSRSLAACKSSVGMTYISHRYRQDCESRRPARGDPYYSKDDKKIHEFLLSPYRPRRRGSLSLASHSSPTMLVLTRESSQLRLLRVHSLRIPLGLGAHNRLRVSDPTPLLWLWRISGRVAIRGIHRRRGRATCRSTLP